MTATHEQVADKFREIIRDWHTPEQVETIDLRNRFEEDPGVCHSHDFCDANMAMMEAMESFDIPVFDETGHINNDTCLFWGLSWDIASKKGFAE